jgi:hypothetical protein
MAFSSFGAAGRRADGLAHVELVERAPGTDWVVAAAEGIALKQSCPIVVDPRSPAAGLLPALRERGVPVVELGAGDLPKACAALQRAVMEGAVRHLGQAPLDAAVASAAVRLSGDSWVWGRAASNVDISPLVAVTMALWQSTGASDRVELFV